MRALVACLWLLACTGDQGLTKGNAPPAAEVLAPADGAVVVAGLVTDLRGAASDPDDDPADLVATWLVDGDVICTGAPAADGATSCEVSLDAGSVNVELDVRDPGNAGASDTVTVTAIRTDPPEVSIESPGDGDVVTTDDKLVFQGTVDDDVDAPSELVVWWEADDLGPLDLDATPDSDGTVADVGNLPLGDHAITLYATDTSGQTSQATVVVDVVAPNATPTCALVAPADGATFAAGEAVAFAGQVGDDAGPTALSVDWSSDRQGALGSSTPDSAGDVAFVATDLSVASHVVSMTATDADGLSCTAQVTVQVGDPPTVTITSPADGAVVDAGDAVLFTADVADAQDLPDAVALVWASDVDGTLDVAPADSTGEAQFVDSALSAGVHAITLTATDSDGLWAVDTIVLTVNELPTAPTVTISPDPPSTTDDLRATIATDAVDPEGAALTYAYAWLVDGVASSASTTSTLPSTATTRGETWTVRVTAFDGYAYGPAGEASVVVANSAPSASAVAIAPDPAYAGDDLSCGWTFSDADGDGDGSTVAWTVDGTPAGTGATLRVSLVGGQTVTCAVTPSDGTASGAVATASLVVSNTAPSIASALITPNPADVGDTLTCAWSGYADPDGDADASYVTWRVGGTPVGSGTTLSTGFGSGDSVDCEVTPYDGADAGAPVTATAVIGNTAPSIALVTISPDPAYAADTLTCAWSGYSDADGDPDASIATWTVDGTPAGSGTTLAGAFVAGDVVACSVVPYDGMSTGTAVSASLAIADSAPSVGGVTIAPDPAYAGDTLTCSWSGFADPDGDADASTAQWWVNGASAGVGATLTAGLVGGDVVTCTVTPSDGTASGAAVSDTLTVSNTAPSIASVSISPDPAYAADTLTCAWSGYADPDGDADASTVAWTVDGTPAGAGSTLAGAFVDGDVVACTVTPSDGAATGSPLSATLTVEDTPPVLASASLTPASPLPGDALSCSPGAVTDADGTTSFTYTYAWRVDGVDVGVTTPTSTAPAKGSVVVCAVTPSDGTSPGAAVDSNAVTVADTPPVASAVSIAPASPATDDVLVASVTLTDADGDGVTPAYAWRVDGALVAWTGSTLDGSTWFDAGDTVVVEVTPNDGEVDGAPVASTAVTVVDSPPSTPTVSIVPDDPIEQTDDLVCQVDVAAVDPDGDVVNYAFAWTVDGAAYTGATATTDEPGDTVPASATSKLEVWACTATASDATSTSGPSADSVEIRGDPLDYAHVQWPCSLSIPAGSTADVYGWAYEPGVTVGPGQGAGVIAELGVGDDGTDPATDASWTWFSAAYDADKDGLVPGDTANDEYMATLTAPSVAGDYDYAYRFSTDDGLSWLYADLSPDCVTSGIGGTDDGYKAATAAPLVAY